MSFIRFNTGQAEPLRQRRISEPPIFRRLSGGVDAALPTAKRRAARRMAGENAEMIPAAPPPLQPGNFPELSRKLAGHCRPFAGAISGTTQRQFQRLFAVLTGANAGLRDGSLPLYARQ